MTKFRHILFPLLLAAVMPASADSFSDLVNSIAASSPTLEAEKFRAEAATEALKAENMLSDPEVEFERLWRQGEGENRWSAGVSQSFDWPGAYSARRRAIRAAASAASARMSATLTACRTQAAQLLIELAAADKEIGILTEISNSMQQLQSKYLEAWEHGETTILDVNKIKLENIRAVAKLEKAISARRTLLSDLHALSGNDSIEIPAEMDMPYLRLHTLDDYMAALESSPEMLAAAADSEAAGEESSVARASRWPGFTLGYNHAFEDGAHFNGFSVGVSLPVYSRKHATRSAAANALAARFDLISQRNRMAAKIESDYRNAVALHGQMDRYAPVVEGVNNLTLLRKALDGGELSLLEFLQEMNYFIEARLDYVEIAREYTLLVALLNANLPVTD